MTTLLVRTVLLYLFLELIMRLMGKRELAQLETGELITTLLLSELAALPLEDREIPMLYAVFPILILVMLEVSLSMIQLRYPRLRQRSRNTPSLLIANGKPDRDELRNNRMTPEELFAALRQQGIADPCEVEYAILEKNGSLSVIPRAAYRPVTLHDLGQDPPKEEGMMHLLISDGVVQTGTLQCMGRNEAWLDKLCRARGYAPEDLYCLMCNDAGRVALIPADRKGKSRHAWKEDTECAR